MEGKPKKHNKVAIVVVFFASVIIIILAFLLFYFATLSASTEQLLVVQNFSVNSKPNLQPISTEIIKFNPPENLPKNQKTGDCFAGSVAAQYRQDAFRCIIDNSIYDPCFTIQNTSGQIEKGIVYCQDGTDDSSGFILKFTKSLPEREVPASAKTNWAWYLVLDDGTECSPFTGTRPFFGTPPDVQIAYYSCVSLDESRQIVLLDELTEGAVWMAQRAIIEKSGEEWKIKSTEKVGIKTVWQ